VGAILDENWRLKREMANGVSDAEIDDWYNAGMKAGALGGKLLGAGRGGFLMFFAPPEHHKRIQRTLSDLKPVTFRFDRTGAQIVFYQASELL
jgi:D-glycero-alpha-D-manno-heptose-7-phosphate kinase